MDVDELLDFEKEDLIAASPVQAKKRKKVIGLDDLVNDHFEEKIKQEAKKRAKAAKHYNSDDDETQKEAKLSQIVDLCHKKMKEMSSEEEISQWGLQLFGNQQALPSVVFPELESCSLMQSFINNPLNSLVELTPQTGSSFLEGMLINGWLSRLVFKRGCLEKPIAEWTFDLILYSEKEELSSSACDFWCSILSSSNESNELPVKVEWLPAPMQFKRALESYGFLFNFPTNAESVNTGSDNEGPPQNIGAWFRIVTAFCQVRYFSNLVVKHDDVLTEMVGTLVTMGKKNELSGVCIAGMGGIGKTTLARSIYEEVKSKKTLYDEVAWVCVSEKFDEKRIFQELFDHLNENGGSIQNFNALLEKLELKLKEKKILLVLDDVWGDSPDAPESWKAFFFGLSNILKSSGSSIVVTTRSDQVASEMGKLLPMHKHDVSKLSNEECWLIIEDMVRPIFSGNSIPSELEAIGHEIAEKCKGLPLVASVIGGTLSRDTKAETWKDIRDNGAWLLNDENKEILSILKISFDRLSSPLKKCFSYCSVFPKDYVIEKDDLIQLWMAQGYLHPSDSMEETGNVYFNDLLSSCLFHDVNWDWKLEDVIVSCKMHDLVHDLALLVSKGETLIWDGSGNISDQCPNVRHLRVQYDGKSPLHVPEGIAQRLHSLFFEGYVGFSEIASNLKSLRSLRLTKYKAGELHLGKLKHLRYLSVSGDNVGPLPKCILNMYNLLTLKLICSASYQELHNFMAILINLRHACFKHRSYGLGCRYRVQLTSSDQSVSQFLERNKEMVRKIGRPVIATLQERENVNRLTNTLSHEEDVLESICPHWSLKGLYIACYRGTSWPSWMMGSSVSGSKYSFHLQNVVELILFYCDNCNEIPNLGELPYLKVLHIEGMPELKRFGHKIYANGSNRVKDIGVKRSVSVLYPALVSLRLQVLDNLEEWVEAAENVVARSQGIVLFPCLERLDISNCPKLETWSMPGFSSDHKLSSLAVRWCRHLMAIPSVEGLSSLKTIQIEYCDSLKSLPIGIESCTSLLELSISSCGPMFIPTNFGRLQSLSSLTISGFYSLRSTDEEDQYQGTSSLLSLPHLKEVELGYNYFSSGGENFELEFQALDCICAPLRSFCLYGWKSLKSLPHQLQHLTTLETLSINNFDGVEALPEWIRNLTSLQELRISYCEELKYMPSVEAMQCLSNLHTFEIRRCLKLKKSDFEEGGPEWPKVSHIPNFKIIEYGE